MIGHWLSGIQVVLTRRLKNLDETPTRRFLTKIFYKLLNILSDIKIAPDTPDFRLIDRKYIEILKKMDERERMFRGLLRWIGFKNYKVIDFVAPPRFKGKSKYDLKGSFRLAIDSIIQFSIKPLRLITFIGVIAAFLSIMLGVYEFINYFIQPPMEINRTTIILTVIFIGSVQLIVLGIIGEYIGRIHIESKGRPLFVCDFYRHDQTRMKVGRPKSERVRKEPVSREPKVMLR
jgi:glycosyltransferase involved in cell wall biosynthesis